jgi:hypothetical protein
MDTAKTITIYDGATGETVVRNMTPEELAHHEALTDNPDAGSSPE